MSTRNFAMLFGFVFLAVGVLGFLGEPFTAAPHGEHPAVNPEARDTATRLSIEAGAAYIARHPSQIAAYFEAFPKMMASIPVVRAWTIGRNEGAGGETHVRKHGFAPNYDVGLTMTFDSPDAYRQYAESAEHQAFFAKYCTPILAERVVVQFHQKD